MFSAKTFLRRPAARREDGGNDIPVASNRTGRAASGASPRCLLLQIGVLQAALSLSGCTSQAVDKPAQEPTVAPSAAASPTSALTGQRVLPRSSLWDAQLRRYSEGRLLSTHNADRSLRTLSGVAIPLPSGSTEAQVAELRTLLGARLSLDEASVLELVSDTVDGSGRRHLRLSQHRNGLRVEGATLLLHFRGNSLVALESSLRTINSGHFEAGLSLQAAADVLENAGWRVDTSHAEERLIPTEGQKAERAWMLFAMGAQGPERLALSVKDGRILRRMPLTENAEFSYCSSSSQLDCLVQASGVDEGGHSHSLVLYRGNGFPPPPLLDEYRHPYEADTYPDIYGTSDDDDVFMADFTRFSTGALYITRGHGYVGDPNHTFLFDEDDAMVFGADATFDDRQDTGDAVSALTSLQLAMDYFSEVHGRQGLSNDPAQPVDVIARVGFLGLNAAWVSQYNYMFYGSWLGTSLAIATDVTGHELAHGVTSFASGLDRLNQPGALNEGISDIFGVMIQAQLTGSIDWWMGEDIPFLIPLRNLKHPEYYGMPGHMSEYVETDSDNGGVHTNMSIPSKAFQLAVEGTEPGETYYGYEVPAADPVRETSALMVARAVYQANEYHLTSEADFADWGVALLTSTDELGLDESTRSALYVSLRAALLATGILTYEDGAALRLVAGQTFDSSTASPLAGATLSLSDGTQLISTLSDENGGYLFSVGETFGSTATLTASAVGYYDSSRQLDLADVAQADPSQLMADVKLEARPPAAARYTVIPSTVTLHPGSTNSISFLLANDGAADSQLSYEVRPSVDYSVQEVSFAWMDVPSFTTPVDMSGDQSHSSELRLGMKFPFYFSDEDSVWLSTDGYFTFSADETEIYEEDPLPSLAAPRHMVAPYWADLDFGSSNSAYVYYDNSRKRAYVQFDQVPDYLQEFVYTFQTILFPDGRIQVHYMDVQGTPKSWARVGLQDAYGEEGLEAYVSSPENESAMPASLKAIEFKPSIPPNAGRVDLQSPQGVISGGQQANLGLRINTTDLQTGHYTLYLRLETNDQAAPLTRIPVSIDVQ